MLLQDCTMAVCENLKRDKSPSVTPFILTYCPKLLDLFISPAGRGLFKISLFFFIIFFGFGYRIIYFPHSSACPIATLRTALEVLLLFSDVTLIKFWNWEPAELNLEQIMQTLVFTQTAAYLFFAITWKQMVDRRCYADY